jgi:tetratricopeptide (TPR) repeat protein
MVLIRVSIAGFLCLFGASALVSAEPGLEQARALLLKGKCAEAAEIYSPLAAKDPIAALGMARCLESQGKSDEATKTLVPIADRRPDVQAELARLALDRGDLKEARTRAQEALRLAPASVLGRLVLAEADRLTGRLDEAEQGYKRLVRYYNDHETKDAETLRWIGRAAAVYARWNRLSDQFDFLVNDLYPDALKLDPLFWPAHYEAGLLFLEKHNYADAVKELKSALELNAQAAEVHAALAEAAMDRREIEKAQESLRRALEINPRLRQAWRMKADLLWLNFQVQEALQLLQENALPLNPIDEETLGRIAACYVVLDGLPQGWGKEERGTPSRFARLVEEVTTRNAHAGTFFLTLAQLLEARNKQSEAEAVFREAIRAMPRLIGPHAGLGMLYMRTGQEGEARKLLKEAFTADSFNVRVKNTLEVLDVLDAMKTVATEHFLVKHQQADAILARYAARGLEAMYPELCREFGYEPPGKSLIEVFGEAQGQSGHAWFSARMVGLPYLGTVAASTGRIVAMTSPNEPGLGRRFNWARVLRHEMVHVVTIQQTKFNIPHWFTEGLAVRAEGHRRPQRWNELLLHRVPQGKLFNLETLNFGFSRPQNNDEWQLAYCQAELYVEYMLSLGDPAVVRKLLAAYSEGLTTHEAIPKALGIGLEEFEKGYIEYVKKLTARMAGLKRPSQASFDELLQARRQRPNDADAAADLAYGHLQRNASREAAGLAQEALRLRRKHALATYVIARLRLAEGKTDEAAAMLGACLDRKAPETLSLNLLAGLKLKARQYDEAAALYALGEQFEPDNSRWIAALVKVHWAADNKPALAEALARLARADADDLPSRKKLAELALAREDYAAAADWANQALEIDVLDAEVHRLLASALTGRKQFVPAIEEFETAIELEPSHLPQRFALADACVQAKQAAKARQALDALLKWSPDYPGAAALLESLKEQP